MRNFLAYLTPGKRQKECVGVDVGYDGIRAVQVRQTKGGPEVVAVGNVPAPPPAAEDPEEEALTAALVSLWEQFDFSSRWVVTAIRGADVVERAVRLPVMPARELPGALKWEAEQLFPFPLDEMVLRHVVLGQIAEGGEKFLNILLVVAPLKTVRRYHSSFTNAGLRLAAVDLPALALWRLFFGVKNERYAQGNFILLELGEQMTRFLVVCDSALLYLRSLRVGLPSKSLLEAAPAASDFALENRKFGFSYQEPAGDLSGLTLEIKRSLEYFQGQFKEKPIQKLLLCGPASSAGELPGLLADDIDLEVEMAEPAPALQGHLFAGGEGFDPGLAVAAGLALKEVLG